MEGAGLNIDIVAWWGAIVATIVAAVELYDRLVRKPLPATSYQLSTSADRGNSITLINGTGTPIMVQHWELFWGRPKWFSLKCDRPIHEREAESHAVFVINPYSSTNWRFVGEAHFPWTIDGERQLYIRLRIVGRRRRVVLLVYNPKLGREGEPLSLRRLLPRSLRPDPDLYGDSH
ncbi:hypothetical protein ABC365_02215 [Brevundimonas sp. 3P9-tot-E]|uniref:hypothetical protein n=1 Tax=unclassified Brevundimonas TaxID=2622653 RepID=UPI0039A2B3A8